MTPGTRGKVDSAIRYGNDWLAAAPTTAKRGDHFRTRELDVYDGTNAKFATVVSRGHVVCMIHMRAVVETLVDALQSVRQDAGATPQPPAAVAPAVVESEESKELDILSPISRVLLNGS